MIPAIWKAEAGGSQFKGLLELHSEFRVFLDHLVRFHLKIKNKKRLGILISIEHLLGVYKVQSPVSPKGVLHVYTCIHIHII